MASSLSLQALESGTGDWNQALLAAGATMAVETCAQGVTEGIRDQLPQRAQGEGQEAYTERCQEAAQALAGRAVASLRILLATGLALAGKDSGDIQACDTAATTGLEENFVTTILAVAYDVAQGVQEVRDEIQEGNYWSAAAQGALAAGSVTLDLASAGVGSTLAKAGVRLARTALSKDKGPGILKKEGSNASGLKATGKQRQEKKADMTPAESRAYFERYKDNPVPVGKYKEKKMKDIARGRTKETGLKYEQHHVYC
ncbi:hypothetical protein HCUR_00339 [Holospora curviuscula]|uniref:Uncharacterized protein n=2 Tax=Holospora curviuscula TaxID=1082868 RepID=A0A2S5RD82_9PROT|nr:hypothetical protein HCUR_00339 [Holospora curviuscula]